LGVVCNRALSFMPFNIFCMNDKGGITNPAQHKIGALEKRGELKATRYFFSLKNDVENWCN